MIMETKEQTKKARPPQEPKVEIPPGARFSYLRDETNPQRVLTIARIYEKGSDSVKFGWSVNVPSSWVRNEESKNRVTLTRGKGDSFSRVSGRNKALTRMKENACTAVLQKNQIPLRAALLYLINEGDSKEFPFHVVEIAKQYVDTLPSYEDFKPCEIPIPAKHKTSVLDKFMKWLRG